MGQIKSIPKNMGLTTPPPRPTVQPAPQGVIKSTNCINCGAVLKTAKCRYCGTKNK